MTSAERPVETPELDKMHAVKEQSETLSRFVDWLEENGYRVCETVVFKDGLDREYFPTSAPYERLFAMFFDIDLEKVEEERRALLDAMRCALRTSSASSK